MPRLQTMGTHSCAGMAIGDFKTKINGVDQKKVNEEYLNNKGTIKVDFVEQDPASGELSVQDFCEEIMYPIEQELGRTYVMCLDHLLDEIEGSDLINKFIIATLNESQYQGGEGYYYHRLIARGFNLVDATKNDWGQNNYIFTRNLKPIALNEAA